MTDPWLCTREDVKRATDTQTSHRVNRQVDQAIAAATEIIRDHLGDVVIHPVEATKTWDWPAETPSTTRSFRVWLDQWTLISVDSVTSGGTVIPSTDYRLLPQRSGPPYHELQIVLSEDSYLQSGSTWQDSLSITGTFGLRDTQVTAGALDGALDDSQTTVKVTDGSLVDVGDLLTVGTERMLVTERAQATTGTTINANVTTEHDADTISVASAAGLNPGEDLQVDAETMHLVSISGTTLSVVRAYDGTGRAAHTSGATLNASRSLTVVRGAQGSTAASHLDAAAVTKLSLPANLVDAGVDVALIRLGWKRTGHSIKVGTTQGRGGARNRSVQIDEILAGLNNLRQGPKVRAI